MKTQLIMLDTPIIVSDEKIKEGDFYVNNANTIFQVTKGSVESVKVISYKKIIAGIEGLPSINWNGLEEEFGWVDVEKSAKVDIKFHHKNIQKREIDYILGYEDGFKKAQSLSERKFSLEDMEKCFQVATNYGCWLQGGSYDNSDNIDWDDYKKTLQQPKIFDIEIDGDWDKEFYQLNNKKEIPHSWSPKITNNSIKIIKKL